MARYPEPGSFVYFDFMNPQLKIDLGLEPG